MNTEDKHFFSEKMKKRLGSSYHIRKVECFFFFHSATEGGNKGSTTNVNIKLLRVNKMNVTYICIIFWLGKEMEMT